MKWKLNSVLFSAIFLIQTYSNCQNYPQGYFTFPIKPGEVNYLSANMGELRSNHFHGGIDVKTDKKIGYPVHASAEGYVSRIKVSSYGYGNVLYIRHPNNYVTVYAHLDKFNTPIGDFVRKKQYEQQTFEIEIIPGKNDLPIKKGEIIALAGNTGSSQGPHLHYEIRDTNDVVLNPASFGFKELTDNLPPVFEQIAITTLDINARVNDEFGRLEFMPLKSGNIYTIPPKITANGLIGLELKAYDTKNNSHNHSGINYIKVLMDGKEIFVHDLFKFSFDETRYINAHMNYSHVANTGKKFEKLYVPDGTKLTTYTTFDPLKGRILIKDEVVHKIKIIIRDDFKNESVMEFSITGKKFNPTPTVASSLPNGFIYDELFENIFKLSSKAPGDPGAQLYFKGNASALSPAYTKDGNVVYLYDLRNGLPDSVRIGLKSQAYNFAKMILSGINQEVTCPNYTVSFPPDALTDTIFFEWGEEFKDSLKVIHIHNKTVPLFDSIKVTLPGSDALNKSQTAVYNLNTGNPKYEGGEWMGNKIEVKTRNFGKFTILEDTTKPKIKFLSNIGNCARFIISDDLSGIESFKATLDGYWILLNYDHKWNVIWTERLDKTVPLKGNFVLEVKDKAGNINTFTIKL